MIAILGGTFDPIHQGHIHIASRVSQLLSVEQVQFMPCAQPVHRRTPHATPEQRCDMINLEISSRPDFVLNRIEIDRKGPSYSVDSLHELQACDAGRLVLILGGDSFAGFANWKQPEAILQMANLVVCRRPGANEASDIYVEHRVDSVDRLEAQATGGILVIDVDAPDCASSTLRQRISRRQLPGDCLSDAVAAYIEQHGLYRNSFG